MSKKQAKKFKRPAQYKQSSVKPMTKKEKVLIFSFFGAVVLAVGLYFLLDFIAWSGTWLTVSANGSSAYTRCAKVESVLDGYVLDKDSSSSSDRNISHTYYYNNTDETSPIATYVLLARSGNAASLAQSGYNTMKNYYTQGDITHLESVTLAGYASSLLLFDGTPAMAATETSNAVDVSMPIATYYVPVTNNSAVVIQLLARELDNPPTVEEYNALAEKVLATVNVN